MKKTIIKAIAAISLLAAVLIFAPNVSVKGQLSESEAMACPEGMETC